VGLGWFGGMDMGEEVKEAYEVVKRIDDMCFISRHSSSSG
jgi:hypothetical protein